MSDSFLQLIAERLRPASERRPAWFSDPVLFVHECMPGLELAPYQERILSAVSQGGRVCVRSPHSTGKTTTSAVLVLWHALSRDLSGVDWKCITTSGSHRQLTKFLWPEIHKMARRIRWDRVGRPPLDHRSELLGTELKLVHGAVSSAASSDPALLEGGHADSLLLVLDESKAIPSTVFDALEGALAGRGEVFALSVSTPGEPSGRFYEIQQRKPGLEDWTALHVTLEEATAAGRVDPEWVEQRRRQWGSTSAVFLNRCMGEFASSDEDGIIPLSWVEAAIERWREWADNGRPLGDEAPCIGVDVARGGADATVMATRVGNVITDIERHRLADVMEVTGHVVTKLQGGATACIDVIGLGAGVFDRLREQKKSVVAFNAAKGSTGKDRSGELEFLNCRAEALWRVREALDPSLGAVLALPPDDELVGDLTAPHWRLTSTGKVQVESKDDLRKRLGRSTDVGDAVVMAVAGIAKPRRHGRMVHVSGPADRARELKRRAVAKPLRNDPLTVSGEKWQGR